MALTLPLVVKAAIPSQNMTLLGAYGGSMNSITLDGDHAYIGQGALVAVVNIANPTQPTRVGQSILLSGIVNAIAISQDHAYVAMGEAGLAVLDVSDPANPLLVNEINTPGSAEDVAVVGNILYVADGPFGLRSFNLNNPAQPSEVSLVDVQYYSVDEIYFADDYLYFLLSGSLYIYTSDPSGPDEVKAIGADYFVKDAVIAGDYVFEADSRGGLRVIDVNLPATATEVALLRSLSVNTSVAVTNGIAYAADHFEGVAALDISDPANITETARFGELLYVDQQVAIAGNTLVQDALYIVPGGEHRRLFFFSLTNPLAPQPMGERSISEHYGASPRVAGSGSHIYVADLQNGAAVLDPADPTGALLGSYTPPSGSVASVALSLTGDHLVTTGGDQLSFADLSTPDNPLLLGALAGSYGAPSSSGDLVFAFNYTTENLEVIDIQNPASPQVIGDVALPGNFATHIIPAGDLLWVANRSGGVVINITTPSAPIPIAFFDPPFDVAGLVVDGDRAYVAAGELGLVVLEVDDPTALDETNQPPTRQTLLMPMLAR